MRLLVMCLAACGASHAPAPPSNSVPTTPQPGLAGNYVAKHAIGMVCDPPSSGLDCEEQVEDTMALTMARGVLHANIQLIQANAHTCTFEQDLHPVEDGHWSFDETNDDGPCHVDLIHKGAQIEIHSEGCRYYCGMRAVLEATFAYPPTGSAVN